MTRLSFVTLMAVWTLGSGAIAEQAKPAPTYETVILNTVAQPAQQDPDDGERCTSSPTTNWARSRTRTPAPCSRSSVTSPSASRCRPPSCAATSSTTRPGSKPDAGKPTTPRISGRRNGSRHRCLVPARGDEGRSRFLISLDRSPGRTLWQAGVELPHERDCAAGEPAQKLTNPRSTRPS